jgi:hypothetical protein
MKSLMLLLLLTGNTVIVLYEGRFNYEEYDQQKYVVEGIVLSDHNDSLKVRVTRAWDSISEVGDTLTFFHDNRLDCEYGQPGLFMADSSGRFTIRGIPRDGFYIMVGRSTPNILTIDDLEDLSAGRDPEFNDHTSHITVHFPISSEEIEILVYPDGEDRITESDYDIWDGRNVYGEICRGPGYSSEFGMHKSDYDSPEDLITFRGDTRKYDNGSYYLDLWPVYPAVGSTEAYEDYLEYGTTPVYVFAIKVGNLDLWPVGLPQESYLVADGRNFYVTGRYMFVPREQPARSIEGPDMQFSAFSTLYGERYSSQKLLLRLDNLDTASGRPLLMTMLEALEDDEYIYASLSYKETADSGPVFYSECRLRLSPPSFTMRTNPIESSAIDLSASVFSFDESGRAVLLYEDDSYAQIISDLDVYNATIRPHNTALFENPEDDGSLLMFHFASIYHYSNHAELSDMLLARVIENLLWEGSLSGSIYRVSPVDAEKTEISTFSLYRRI